MCVPIDEVADWRLSDEAFLKAFKLPQKGSGALALLYPFPREDRISFDEEKHEYTIDGKKAPRSVTGLLHEYAQEFDATRALVAMKNGREWDAKKAAMEEDGLATDDASILCRWQRNGEVARARGHLLHYQAEMLANGRIIELPHSPELQQAIAIYERLLGEGLQPFRAEVNLFHCGLRVAGQPDLLMRDPDNNVVIVDWKRAKSIKTENDRCHLKYPLGHLPDTNYWHYSLQVNVYGYILESEYGMKVAGYKLAVVHPDASRPKLINCPRMDAEMSLIRDFEIEQGRASSA